MRAFGSEYAQDPRWGGLQRLYIQIFGIVDLPTRIRARAISQVLRTLSYEYFLDFGAGTGVYSLFLTRNPQCAGLVIDVDEDRIDSIKYLAHKLERTRLNALCANEDALRELPTSTFSVVLAIEVLMCVNSAETVLRELMKRLRPGGVLIAHVPIRLTRRRHEHTLFNDATLKTLFEEAGFSHIEIRHTFSSMSVVLCELFSNLVAMPMILAFVYPLLLLAVSMTPRFVRNGDFRLIVARKSHEEGFAL